MIDFISKKYGGVRIFEPKDRNIIAGWPVETKIVGSINPVRKTVKLFKNVYGSLIDPIMKQYIFNAYNACMFKEKNDSIESRWEILDI